MKFDKVIKAFKEYCTPHRNSLHERHKFWSLKEDECSEETELAVHTLTNNLPISEKRKTEFKIATKSDQVLQHVHKLTMNGWPENINVPQAAREFWKVRDEISVADGLLLVGEQLVIPHTMKVIALAAIHEGHLEIEKCKQ